VLLVTGVLIAQGVIRVRGARRAGDGEPAVPEAVPVGRPPAAAALVD
jgi:hypothetical protein